MDKRRLFLNAIVLLYILIGLLALFGCSTVSTGTDYELLYKEQLQSNNFLKAQNDSLKLFFEAPVNEKTFPAIYIEALDYDSTRNYQKIPMVFIDRTTKKTNGLYVISVTLFNARRTSAINKIFVPLPPDSSMLR